SGPPGHGAEDSARRGRLPRRVTQLSLLALTQLADARLLADAAAQVVQLGAVDVADGGDVDLVDLRRVQRERGLHAHAERVLAHREGLADAGALALDHDPLVDLDPLPVPLDHAEVDAHGVARLEAGHVAQLATLEVLDDRAHAKRRPEGRTRVAEVDSDGAGSAGTGAGGGARDRGRPVRARPPRCPG